MRKRRGERLGCNRVAAASFKGARRALTAALSTAGLLGLVGMVGMAGMAQAADAQPTQRQMLLEPSASVSQTFTDNHDLRAGSGGGEAITRLTAGIAFRRNAGAVRGYLDYALSSLLYARHSERNSLQNALSANLSADLIDDRLQLLATASIARSAVSAFGVQPGRGADANANTTEVRTFRLAPTLRGPLGPGLRYTASLGHAITNSGNGGSGGNAGNAGIGNNAVNGDVSSSSANVRLEPTSAGMLRWGLDATHQASDYKRGRSTRTDRLLGSLRLDLDDFDLQLSANGGTERTDLASLDARNYRTWGMGLLWTPSPITRVSADFDHRFFGRSHSLSLQHRTPRTIWRYRNARTLSSDDNNQLRSLIGPASQVLATLLGVPDGAPQLSNLLSQLRLTGNELISAGFLQSAVTLQDLQELSAAWTGQRNAAVVVLSRTNSRRVDTLSSAFDDHSRTAEVQLSSLSLNLSHRLTPQSALTLALTSQTSRGSSSQFASRQALVDLQLTTRLSPESSASLSLRHGRYKTGAQPFDENAVTASYSIRF